MNLYGYLAAALLILILGFCAGWQVNGWRLSAALAHEQAAHQTDLRAVSSRAAAAAQEALARHQADTRAITALQAQIEDHAHVEIENADLRAAVAAGTRRLSVAAHCSTGGGALPGATVATGIADDHARADIDPATAARILALANTGDDAIRQLTDLQQYVRTVCARN